MKVKTNLTRLDLLLLNVSLLPRLRSTYTAFLVLASGIFAWSAITIGPETMRGWMIVLIGSLIGGVLAVLAGFVFSLLCTLFLPSGAGILGEHEYELLPEGLLERTSVNESINKWKGITSVTRAGKYLVFGISGWQFHPIPMRSFASKQAFDEFASEATRLWKAN